MGEDEKVASSHRGVQAAGRGANEDLRKHRGFGAGTEVTTQVALHLEVSIR